MDYKIFSNLTNKFSFTAKIQIALPRGALQLKRGSDAGVFL